MARKLALGALLSLLASACGQDHREPLPEVDCSVEDRYELDVFSSFSQTQTGWFLYSDPTPGGAPNPVIDTDAGTEDGNIPQFEFPTPRCGDTVGIRLQMYGKNFWGAGFGDWTHNPLGSRINGSDWEGLAFWARAAINSEKEFLFNVDDARTMINPPQSQPFVELPDGSMVENQCYPELPNALGHEDFDGDGCLGPGDRVAGSECRLPPPEDVGDVPCYNGGVDAPANGGVRVPEADECGNQFHTRITTTETWQLFVIPWRELVQWPCPNRLAGGIRKRDISKFEIKFTQGMQYDIWIDNIALYKSR